MSLLLRLDSAVLTRLLGSAGPGPAAVGEALEASGAAAVLLGADRLGPGHAGRSPGLEPSVAATLLAGHTRTVGLLVSAAPQRDHPYNLARRIASLDHVSGGRAGWLVGHRDTRLNDGGSPWHTGRPGPAATADAVTAVRRLWRSWPADALLGDREAGVFTDTTRIRHADHTGVFDTAGPLNVPEGPQGEPIVLAWWVGGPLPDADAVVLAGAAGPDTPRPSTGLPLFGPVPQLGDGDAGAGLHGHVLAVADLPHAGLAPAPAGATLRDRLGLPGRPAASTRTGRPFVLAP